MTTKKMAIIATKGTLDMAYPPFILASTAAALGYEVQIFFTFYGLQLLRKDLTGAKAGIYRYSRNPMYVGLAAMLSAWAIYLRSPVALSGVAVFILYMNRFQITPEERALESLFAEEFVAYRARVRRWL